MYKKASQYAFAILLIGLVVVALALLVPEAKSQTQFRSHQIAPKAIHGYHFNDSLAAALVWEQADSTAWYAKYARGMVDGSLQWADFSQGLKDSLIGSASIHLIHWSDTSGFAKSLAAGAITDTSMFDANLRTLMTGRLLGGPWIYLAANALSASDALYASEAGHALTADAALTAPTQLHANTADTATVALVALLAISSDTTVGDGMVSWLALDAGMKDSVYNAPHYADSAGKVVVGGISSTGQFSTGLLIGTGTAVIPTTDMRAAMRTNSFGAALSSNNVVVDSTGLYKNFVKKLDATFPVAVDIGNGVTLSNFEIEIDTVTNSKATIRFMDGEGDVAVWNDSTTVTSVLNSALADYVLRGTGSVPVKLHVANGIGTVGGASAYDWAIDYSDSSLYLRNGTGTAWIPIGGGGASTAAATLLRDDAAVDADSAFIVTRTNTVTGAMSIFQHRVAVDSLIQVGSGSMIGTTALPFLHTHSRTLSGDTLANLNTGGRTGAIQLDDTLLFTLGGASNIIGGAPITYGTFIQNPFIYAKQLELCSDNTDHNSIIMRATGSSTTNIYPEHETSPGVGNSSNGSIGLYGSPSYQRRWDYGVFGDYLDVRNVTDYVRLQTTGYPAIGTSGDISALGDVAAATGSFSGPVSSPVFNASAEYEGGGGGISGGNRGYLVSPDQNNALDSACGANNHNPFITREYLKRMAAGYYPADLDSFGLNWLNMFTYITRAYRDTLSCPGLNDTTPEGFVPDLDPSMFVPVVIDSGPRRLNPSGWPLPGVQGMVHIDTTIQGLTKAPPAMVDWQNPFLSRKYIVMEGANDDIGMYTGYFGTIQAALANPPNILCTITDARSGNAADSFYISKSVNVYLRYGATVVDTLTSIPSIFKTAGAWVLLDSGWTSGLDSARVWQSINYFYNDSAFTVFDTTFNWDRVGPFIQSIVALPWEIEIWPSTNTAMWAEDSLLIPSVCPLWIHGVGKSTVLTNFSANKGFETTTNGSLIFYYPNSTTQLPLSGNHAGLPITISDMSIVSAKPSVRNSALRFVGGVVTLSNIDIASRQVQGGDIVTYTANSAHDNQRYNALTVENCVLSADSDVWALKFTSTCKVLSTGNTYSLSGDSGAVVFATDNLGSSLQFIRDDIYIVQGVATLKTFTASNAQTGLADTLTIAGCRAVGADLSVDGTNFKAIYTGGNNIFNSAVTEPPRRVQEVYRIFRNNSTSPK